tara:strand:+ start:15342 stop:15746 length:405 start_codon:yes stop_codon:yes gene_type:complete
LPTVTFKGPAGFRRRNDLSGQWFRGEPVEVSQEWLNEYRNRLPSEYFSIKDDEGETIDFGNDGIPDSGWTKKDISKWLKEKGATFSGYSTKSKLLDLVESTLNPPVVEEVIEEITEETIIKDGVGDTLATNGDE